LALLSSFKDPASWRVSRSVLWVAVVLSSAVVAMTRSIGPLWIAVALVAAIALIGWRPFIDALRQRSTYLPVSLVALFMLASVGWTVGAGTLGGQAQASDAPLVGGDLRSGVHHDRSQHRGLSDSSDRSIRLLDTTVSPLTYAIYFSAIVLLIALALTASSRKHTLTMLGAIVVAITLPGVIQGASVASTGIIWQGRYALVLYIGILIMASWILSVHSPRVDFLSTRVTAVIAVLLTAFHVISFGVVMWRYVVGFDDIVTKMLSAPEWQPPLGWITLTVGYSLVAAGMAAWGRHDRARPCAGSGMRCETSCGRLRLVLPPRRRRRRAALSGRSATT
jgi:hypothetical protein